MAKSYEDLPRRRAVYKRDVLAAVMLVSAATTGMAFLFRIDLAGAGTPANAREQLAEIDFMPLGRERATDADRNLVAWMQLLDPTILSLPNETYGFSQVRATDFERPFRGFERAVFKVQPLPPQPAEPLQLVAPVGDVIAAALQARLHRVPISVAPLPVPRFGAAVLWTDRQGEIIDSLPPLVLPGRDEIVETTGPTHLLVMQYTPPQRPEERLALPRLRVRVQTSCGDLALDQAAASHLRRYFSRRSRQRQNTDALATPLQLLCYWRFLPNVMQKPSSKDRPWHDLDWY